MGVRRNNFDKLCRTASGDESKKAIGARFERRLPVTIFWWFFTLTCLSPFFFSYGMGEGLSREWIS